MGTNAVFQYSYYSLHEQLNARGQLSQHGHVMRRVELECHESAHKFYRLEVLTDADGLHASGDYTSAHVLKTYGRIGCTGKTENAGSSSRLNSSLAVTTWALAKMKRGYRVLLIELFGPAEPKYSKPSPEKEAIFTTKMLGAFKDVTEQASVGLGELNQINAKLTGAASFAKMFTGTGPQPPGKPLLAMPAPHVVPVLSKHELAALNAGASVFCPACGARQKPPYESCHNCYHKTGQAVIVTAQPQQNEPQATQPARRKIILSDDDDK